MQFPNLHLKKFIQEKELKASILMEKTVSNNIKHIPKMEVCLKNIFKERTKFDGLQVEATNEKIQSKIRDSYGPLANIWQYLEGLNAAKKETVNVNMEHLLSCTQQTILLFQQSLNIMMYHRKYYALLSIMSHAGC